MSEIEKKNIFNFGIITGVIVIIITTICYVIDLNLLVNIWIGLSIIGISIILGIISVIKFKVSEKGFISFKQAFKIFFLTLAFGVLIQFIFNYILFHLIDPEAGEIIKQITIENNVKTMQDFNTPAEKIKETVTDMQNEDTYSLLNQLKAYVIFMFLYIIIGLIVAAALRRKKPEFGN
jgi:hypothetical protein